MLEREPEPSRPCQAANKDYEEAVKSFLAALRADPDNKEVEGEEADAKQKAKAHALKLQADAKMAKAAYGDAAATYAHAVALDPSDEALPPLQAAAAAKAQAQAAKEQGDQQAEHDAVRDALASYDKAIALDTEDSAGAIPARDALQKRLKEEHHRHINAGGSAHNSPGQFVEVRSVDSGVDSAITVYCTVHPGVREDPRAKRAAIVRRCQELTSAGVEVAGCPLVAMATAPSTAPPGATDADESDVQCELRMVYSGSEPLVDQDGDPSYLRTIQADVEHALLMEMPPVPPATHASVARSLLSANDQRIGQQTPAPTARALRHKPAKATLPDRAAFTPAAESPESSKAAVRRARATLPTPSPVHDSAVTRMRVPPFLGAGNTRKMW